MPIDSADPVNSPRRDGFDVRAARRATLVPIAVSFPVAAVLWSATYFLLPPLAGMETAVPRLLLALKCICLAVLFCLVTGVEAVAHERLVSPAIDPLSGYDTHRMRVNLRYLQNTLEQVVIFAAALLGLAIYCGDGASVRAVPATTLVWVAARIAFWIGYHRSFALRALGGPGMMLSMLVLLYVAARFGLESAGPIGAAAPIVLFLVAEAVLFWATKPRRI